MFGRLRGLTALLVLLEVLAYLDNQELLN